MRHWQAKVRPHWIEIVLAAALVVVGVGQVYLYIRQAGIMNTQAQIAEGQLAVMKLEGRAWVSIDAPPSFGAPLAYDVNGALITLLLTFNNYGHSPAQNVSTFFEAFPGLGCHTDAECLVIQKRVCGVAANSSTGLTVFPGEHPQLKEAQSISNDAIATDTAKMPAAFKAMFPHIFLCITYNIAESDEIKRTPYAFDVIRTDGAALLTTDRKIPANELIVRISPLFEPMSAN